MLGFSSYFSIHLALMEENVTPGQKGGVGLPSPTHCSLGSGAPWSSGPWQGGLSLGALTYGSHSPASQGHLS